jgi:hypothetical protein
MMEWILIICTAGWGMCGTTYLYGKFETQEQCLTSLEQMYWPEPEAIKYAVCIPEKKETTND